MLDVLQSNTFQIVSTLGFLAYSGYTILGNKSDITTNEICDYKELKPIMGDGIKCSEHVRLSVKQSYLHTLAIAPCEKGKSRRFIMQNVNSLKNCSLVVTDPACEIAQTCNPDKKVYILNPFSENTVGYNPLENCKNEYEVSKLAQVILLNGMNAYVNKNGAGNTEDFVGMATPLLSAYMIMNYYTKKYSFSKMIEKICTMPTMSEIEKDENGKVIKATSSIELEILMSGVESAIIKFKSFKHVAGTNGTLCSIMTVMNTCLQIFLDKNVKHILDKPNLDMKQIRKEESVIYIQIPERHSKYFSPLTATFITQLFDKLMDNDGLPTFFLLDEMCNIGILPDIKELLGTIRKYKIGIVAAIQSLLQLNSLYGETEGNVLRDLFSTLLVCGGLKETEYISNLLGTKDYYENNVKYTKPLMTQEEIRRLNKDKMLIISNDKRPVIDDMMEVVL